GWQVAGALLLLALITLIAVRQRREQPYLLFGWLWYLGMLVPVIGLVQVGMQAMADRYTYLPAVGIFLLATWGGADLLARWRVAWELAAVLTACVLVASAAATVYQLGYWQNSITLWQHDLAAAGENDTAHVNLGSAFEKKSDAKRAM